MEQSENVNQILPTNVYLLTHLKCHVNDRKGAEHTVDSQRFIAEETGKET